PDREPRALDFGQGELVLRLRLRPWSEPAPDGDVVFQSRRSYSWLERPHQNPNRRQALVKRPRKEKYGKSIKMESDSDGHHSDPTDLQILFEIGASASTN